MTNRRLTIPALRPRVREELRPVKPYFLRTAGNEPEAAGPVLLSFDSDRFLEAFLALATGTANPPQLLPWRDWSEPPAAMLRPGGGADYPVESIQREAPLALGEDLRGTDGIDADGIPAGSPPWLRKLYLPQHGRFTIAAFDIVCRAAGWPRLDRSRVVEAGMVVRRLVRGQGERWEDWIASDDREGRWSEILDGSMRLLEDGGDSGSGTGSSTPSAPVDPAVGGLLSHLLSLVPSEAGEAGHHCSFYGYLPVFSAARQAHEALQSPSPSQIGKVLAARASDSLDKLFKNDKELQVPAELLQQLLQSTVLPQWPPKDVEQERKEVETYTRRYQLPISESLRSKAVTVAIDLLLEYFLAAQCKQILIPAGEPLEACAGPLANIESGQVSSGQEIWDYLPGLTEESVSKHLARMATQHQDLNELSTDWLAANFREHSACWDRLVQDRLRTLIYQWLNEKPLLPDSLVKEGVAIPEIFRVMVAAALVRVRCCRLALAHSIGEQCLADDEPTADLLARDPEQPNLPLFTLAALGESVAAFLALEDQRDHPGILLPWQKFDPPGGSSADQERIRSAHQAAWDLAEFYGPIDRSLASAGAAAASQLTELASLTSEKLEQLAEEICDSAFQDQSLPHSKISFAALGIELLEQPAMGLLVLPGLHPEKAPLAEFQQKTKDYYTEQDPETLAIPEYQATQQVQRLRFDADHLYAVRAWVRVEGKGPCALPRVIWTPRSEPFSIAEPTDVLGVKPCSIPMPDIPRMLRDLPRVAKARANPFAAVIAPPHSGVMVGDEIEDTRRDWGLAIVTGYAIPVITICALVIFKIIFKILMVLPGFTWMPNMKLRLSIRGKSS